MVFLHPRQLHFSEQGTPLLKHSQYFLRQADLRHLQPVLCTTAVCCREARDHIMRDGDRGIRKAFCL